MTSSTLDWNVVEELLAWEAFAYVSYSKRLALSGIQEYYFDRLTETEHDNKIQKYMFK